MTQGILPHGASDYGHSRWAQLAALLLVAMGSFVVILGTLTTAAMVPAVAENGLRVLGYGMVQVAFGILYIATGVAAWRHHLWAVFVGLLLCIAPIWIGLQLAPDVFNPVRQGEPGEIIWAATRWVVVTAVVPHCLIVAGLALGIQHFVRRG